MRQDKVPSEKRAAARTPDNSAGEAARETHGETLQTHECSVTCRSFVPELVSDRYTVGRFESRGGEGEVWSARDERIGRRVALKKLRKNTQIGQRRFLAEAQITGQLEHPGVVPVHDLGRDRDGHAFYTMKFVEGRTLESAIEDFHASRDVPRWEAEVERRRLLECFLDTCDAVAYAHSRGVIHRDIKPDNVMLGPFGETLVLDWGLAKVLGQPDPALLQPAADADLSAASVELTDGGGIADTQAGSVLGTPAYMPPELAAGRASEVGVACDVYLLGATLYHVLTGQAPRTGRSQEAMIKLARTAVPEAPSRIIKGIPQPLEAICLKAMAKRECDRYQSALAVAEEVRRYLAGQPVLSHRESTRARFGRWTRANWQPMKWTLITAAWLGPLAFWLSNAVQGR